MKKLTLAMLFLLFTSSAFAAQIVISHSSGSTIASQRTRLPWNVLLAKGPLCYTGQEYEVTEIVERMISNYSYPVELVEVRSFSLSNETTLTYVFEARGANYEVRITPCN